MRVRGEFRIDLGGGIEMITPNQFTVFGMQRVLAAAFQGVAQVWQAGLCAHNPGDALALSEMGEPTIGVNGYARPSLPLDITNWPSLGVINGESFINSRPFIFPAAGAYDVQVNRLFLTDGSQVIAVGSQIDGGLQTIVANLTASYRLYFR